MKKISTIKKGYTAYTGIVSYGDKNYKLESDLKKLFSFDLKQDELLIKLSTSPLNPSDFYMHQGTYLMKREIPHIAGSEGYGEIINVGDKDKYTHLIGKKGNCVFTGIYGAYANYSVCKIKNFFEFENKDNKSNLFLVNPLTVVAFYKIMERKETQSFLQSGASTVVGKLFLILNSFSKKKYDSVNIVRNDKHFNLLNSLGSSSNLNSTSNNFKLDLKENIAKYKPSVFFDCVGGILTGIAFNYLPNDAEIIVYGALANKAIVGIDPSQLIFTKKNIRGFHLFYDFFNTMNINDVKEELEILYDNSNKVEIKDKEFCLNQFDNAIMSWLEKGRNYRIVFKM